MQFIEFMGQVTGHLQYSDYEDGKIGGTKMDRLIYLDNAATTKTAPEVVEAMLPYFTENYGNPSSVYGFAAKNKEAVASQRETIADILGVEAKEIYFTAGGNRGVPRQITGRLKRRRKAMLQKEIISLRRRLSTMRFFIPRNIWRRGVSR